MERPSWRVLAAAAAAAAAVVMESAYTQSHFQLVDTESVSLPDLFIIPLDDVHDRPNAIEIDDSHQNLIRSSQVANLDSALSDNALDRSLYS